MRRRTPGQEPRERTMWIARVIFGTAVGALAGLLLARARLCAGGGCRSRSHLGYSALAGAVAGAALSLYALGN